MLRQVSVHRLSANVMKFTHTITHSRRGIVSQTTKFGSMRRTVGAGMLSAGSADFLSSGSCIAPAPQMTWNQTRFLRDKTNFKADDATASGEKAQESTAEGTAGGAAGEGAKAEGDAKEEEQPKVNFLVREFRGLKHDITSFPDIYNAPNMLNMAVFTIFCLCSTGSNVEADVWTDQCGVDGGFRPWTWLLHSVMTNNFLSMAFAMMLIHSMGHSVLPNLGTKGFVAFCALTAAISGFGMFLLNQIPQLPKEKQFGPWDICSALFVMQFLHQGFKPWQILNGFTGWVKYACWVGAVCILYYDWQPVMFGSLVGLALCKGVFKAPIVKAP